MYDGNNDDGIQIRNDKMQNRRKEKDENERKNVEKMHADV